MVANAAAPDHVANETMEIVLKRLAGHILPEETEDSRQIVDAVVSTFSGIASRDSEYSGSELITLEDDGRGGGVSSKPENLTLNWNKLFNLIPDLVLTGTALSVGPWVLPFVALHVWNAISDASKVKISPRHAMCLYAMWQQRDGQNRLAEEDALLACNEYLVENDLPGLNEIKFAGIIDTLTAVGCVEIENGVIWLAEKVRTPSRSNPL